MRARPLAAALALGMAAVAQAACSTTATRFEGDTFRSAKGYSVKLPGGGWRVQSSERADLELRRDDPPGGMLADATCEGRELDRPLPVLARHVTFGLAERTTVESDTRPRAGRPAAHSVVRGNADGAEVQVEAVVVKGARCIHDFLYVAPAAQFEAGRRDFQAFVESFSEEAPTR